MLQVSPRSLVAPSFVLPWAVRGGKLSAMCRLRRLLVGALGAATFLFAACSAEGDDAPPHVLFILVDTLRVDHTGLGDYERDTTPGLDELAKEGTIFRNHFANAPWTKPSVASIITGLLPPTHGCQWGDFHRAGKGQVDLLAQGFTTMPEVLQENGWATIGLMTNQTLTSRIGFDQGFDRFDVFNGSLVFDEQVAKAASQLLDNAKQPTFVWCHLMAPHNYKLPPQRQRQFESEHKTPIRAREPNGEIIRDKYGMEFREQALDIYDETVLYTDELLTELITSVRERHPNTLIIFTSDHGEEFGEHGGYLHARTLFNELLRVPLVIWGPGVGTGEVVTDMTHSVDLFPTVMDLLHLPELPTQGQSLFGEAPAPEEIYAEKIAGTEGKRALITKTGKLIEHKPPGPDGVKPDMTGKGQWLFFKDPLGIEDQAVKDSLSKQEFEQRRRFMQELRKACRELHELRSAGSATQGVITDEELEILRKLGYVE